MKTILWLFLIFAWACAPPAEEPDTAENAGTATAEQTDNALTPEEKEAGWILLFDGVFALETYAGSGNDGARIEEMLAVTSDGYRMLSKFPSAKLISCPCVGSVLP